MKIYLATDHAGFALKESIKKWLDEWEYDYEDVGAFEYDEQDDYPDFMHLAAEAVSEDPKKRRAIILGGSGQGEAIVANRYKGVRAAVYTGGDMEVAKLSREHNDANVLSLGARFVTEYETKNVVRLWLDTPFSGDERHKRRIKKIDG